MKREFEKQEEIQTVLHEEREQIAKLNKMIVENEGWITTQTLHPDGYAMKYDGEWPKTAAHFTRLFALKTFDLQEIYTEINLVDGKKYTVGINFMFYGEAEPITYGRFDGKSCVRAVFKRSE